MKMQITVNLHKDFIINMIALFIASDSGRKTKGGFLSYMRNQIESYGTDDSSQFGESFEPDYFNDIQKAYKYYGKWFG